MNIDRVLQSLKKELHAYRFSIQRYFLDRIIFSYVYRRICNERKKSSNTLYTHILKKSCLMVFGNRSCCLWAQQWKKRNVFISMDLTAHCLTTIRKRNLFISMDPIAQDLTFGLLWVYEAATSSAYKFILAHIYKKSLTKFSIQRSFNKFFILPLLLTDRISKMRLLFSLFQWYDRGFEFWESSYILK